MKYWKEMYGTQSKDFIDGVIAGVTSCAIWKNGKQRVGVMEILLEDYIADIKIQLGYPEEEKHKIGK